MLMELRQMIEVVEALVCETFEVDIRRRPCRVDRRVMSATEVVKAWGMNGSSVRWRIEMKGSKFLPQLQGRRISNPSTALRTHIIKAAVS